jgi:hypothetical protein
MGQLAKWSNQELEVVDRFARAVVSGEYPNVKAALPACRSELERVEPVARRTDVAVAWRVLCRAYDMGLARRKHFWTRGESRLVKSHASALARGEYPDTPTAVCYVKGALVRAGLGLRHPDKVLQQRVHDNARKMGMEPVAPKFGPTETTIIARFSRALARNEYPNGTSAAAECSRAYVRAGINHRRSLAVLAVRINAGARTMGWIPVHRPWSASGTRVIDRYAWALVSGEYPSIAAAVRACQESLKRAREFGSRTEAGLARKLRAEAMRRGQPQSRPRWKRNELRVVDKFARACIQGKYPNAAAAAAGCRRALERAGLPEHLRREAVTSKLLQRVHELR